jgi:hypothetical protein
MVNAGIAVALIIVARRTVLPLIFTAGVFLTTLCQSIQNRSVIPPDYPIFIWYPAAVTAFLMTSIWSRPRVSSSRWTRAICNGTPLSPRV